MVALIQRGLLLLRGGLEGVVMEETGRHQALLEQLIQAVVGAAAD